MRDQVKFGMIRTQEEFSDLKAFAKTFDHNVGNDAALPIYTIECGERLIGYFNLILYPVLCPSFHPKYCTHRNFHEAAQSLRNHFCLQSIDATHPNGTCLMALPKKLTIKLSALEHMGFKRIDREIWQFTP